MARFFDQIFRKDFDNIFVNIFWQNIFWKHFLTRVVNKIFWHDFLTKFFRHDFLTIFFDTIFDKIFWHDFWHYFWQPFFTTFLTTFFDSIFDHFLVTICMNGMHSKKKIKKHYPDLDGHLTELYTGSFIGIGSYLWKILDHAVFYRTHFSTTNLRIW